MRNAKDNIEIGIVLSGGMSKGAYEVGFCKALVENSRFKVKAISAASVGVLNGYALAVNKIEQIVQVWKKINANNFRQMYENIFKRCKIYELIDEYCDSDDILNMSLSTVCWAPPSLKADYIELNECLYEERKKYIKASVAVASVMKSVEINNKKYYDGAIVDNTPIYPLLSKKLDLIIVIQFDGYIPKYEVGIVNCPILFLNLQDDQKIKDSFDFSKDSVETKIDFGYQKANKILHEIEEKYDHYEELIKLINYYNSNMKESVLSGDYLVRRLNRISEKLR